MKDNKVTIYLTGIYILLIGLQEPFHAAGLEGKIQISDLWFLVMIGTFFYYRNGFIAILKVCFSNQIIKGFFLSGFLYLFIYGISVCISYSATGLILWLGKCYLLAMTGIFLFYLLNSNESKIIDSIFYIFNAFGYSLSVVGIVGWILSISGFHNETTQIYQNYPYFGDAHRLKAFTTTPSMYISMITICIVLGLSNFLFYRKSKFQFFSVCLFTLSAFLAFTKSFLFIVAAWIILYLFKYYKKPLLLAFVFLSFLIAHFFLSHFLIISNRHLNDRELTESPYTSNELIYSANNFSIIGSGYYTFKKTAWLLFKENPILGLGPGNYNKWVAVLKEEGRYPKNLPNFDPHSSYMGALAETGILGFIVLVILGLSIGVVLLKTEIMTDSMSFSLFLLFCIMIAEGISMDTMNFRHYWVIVSILLFQYVRIRNRPLVKMI